jgi:hypothetical protein
MIAFINVKEHVYIFLSAVLSFLAPAGMIMLAVGAFIIFDTIFGWYKHKKKPSGANSKGLRMGFTSKSLVYLSLILVFYLVDYAMINEMLLTVLPFSFIATKAVALVLIYFELISINENFKEIKGMSLAEAFMSLTKSVKKAKDNYKEIKED